MIMNIHKMSSGVTMPASINKKKQELPFVVISPADKRNSGMIGLLSNGKSVFRLNRLEE